MTQMNILGKPARHEPVKVPAEIEEKAKAMLEPEEEAVVTNSPPADTKTRVHSERGEYVQQSEMADHVHIPTICPMCKQDKELQWVNPGALGANTEICKDCIPKLFGGYGYKEPGYRIMDESTVEIFSETTGWEKIKTYWVKEIRGNIFPNDLFPLAVILEHEEIKAVSSCKLDHETFGITWAAARFLSVKANVPMPATEPANNVAVQL